jgi:hypothetical protein
MMPSIIGVVFLVASLSLFRKGSSYLFGLLVFSGIFQAASIVSSESSIGVQPYYLVVVLFLVRCTVDATLRYTDVRPVIGMGLLCAFVALSVASAILYPLIFPGVFVDNPALVDPARPLSQVPLKFSSSNITQACLLVVNGTVVLAAGLIPGKIEHGITGLMSAFYLFLIILVAQIGCLSIGVSFPYAILNNNQHYALANMGIYGGYSRPNGTFSEPSMAGALLLAIALASMARYLESGRGRREACLAFLGLLMVASASSFLAAAIGILLLFARYPVTRFPGYIRLTRLKRMSVLLILPGVVLVALAVPQLRQNLIDQTLNKGASFSFAVRASQDLSALRIARETYGIGVGLGSNRPASLVAALLSTVGLGGLILFLAMVYCLFRNHLGGYTWLKWVSIGLLLDMACGIPDISFPLLWITLALVARATQQALTTKDKHAPETVNILSRTWSAKSDRFSLSATRNKNSKHHHHCGMVKASNDGFD